MAQTIAQAERRLREVSKAAQEKAKTEQASYDDLLTQMQRAWHQAAQVEAEKLRVPVSMLSWYDD